MGLFGRLQASIAAAAGANPQVVVPQGWVLGGAGISFTRNPLTFSASMTPDLALGNWITITATSNIAFALNNPLYNGAPISPTNFPAGMFILLNLFNSSGGALGAFTPGSVWKGAGGFAAPGNGLQNCSLNIVLSATQIIGIGNWSTAVTF